MTWAGLFLLLWGLFVLLFLWDLSFLFIVGNTVIIVSRVLLKPVSSAWNFTQTLSFLRKKEEEYTVRVESCFSVSFIKHKSFEH